MFGIVSLVLVSLRHVGCSLVGQSLGCVERRQEPFCLVEGCRVRVEMCLSLACA